MSGGGNGDRERGEILAYLARIEDTIKEDREQHEVEIAEDRAERRALSKRVGELEKWRSIADVNLDAIRNEVREHGQRLMGMDGKLDTLVSRTLAQADTDQTQNREIAKLDKGLTVANLKQKAALAMIAAGGGAGGGWLGDTLRNWLQASGKH